MIQYKSSIESCAVSTAESEGFMKKVNMRPIVN